MAQGLAERYGHDHDIPVTVRSAGTLRIVGRSADRNAIRVMQEVGVDIRQHKSAAITAELLDWAHYVLVMESVHLDQLREQYGELGDNVLLLARFAGLREIDDPIGGWRWRFRRIRRELTVAVHEFMDQLPA